MYRWLCGRCKYIHSQHTVYLLFSISFHRPSPLSFSFRFTSLVSPLGSLPTHPSLHDSKRLLLSGRSVSKHLLSQYFEYIICLFLSPPPFFCLYIRIYINIRYPIILYIKIFICVWCGLVLGRVSDDEIISTSWWMLLEYQSIQRITSSCSLLWGLLKAGSQPALPPTSNKASFHLISERDD